MEIQSSCARCLAADIVRRIYVERNGTRGGCVTLSDIWDAGNTVNMPLYRIEPSTNQRECQTYAHDWIVAVMT